jgi:hypothetical protein
MRRVAGSRIRVTGVILLAALGFTLLVVIAARLFGDRPGQRRRRRPASSVRSGASSASANCIPLTPPPEPVAWDVVWDEPRLRDSDGNNVVPEGMDVDGNAWLNTVEVQVSRAGQGAEGSAAVEADEVQAQDVSLPPGYTPTDSNHVATIPYVVGKPTLPSGFIIMWADSRRRPEGRWRECNGENGTPNLWGKYLKGAESLSGAGQSGGQSLVPLEEAHLPPHTHALTGEMLHETSSGAPTLSQPSTTCSVVAGAWQGAAAAGPAPANAMKIAARAVRSCDDWEAIAPTWRDDPAYSMVASTKAAGGASSEVTIDHKHDISPDGSLSASVDVRPRAVWVGYYISYEQDEP